MNAIERKLVEINQRLNKFKVLKDNEIIIDNLALFMTMAITVDIDDDYDELIVFHIDIKEEIDRLIKKVSFTKTKGDIAYVLNIF